jgi:hypothetical protein
MLRSAPQLPARWLWIPGLRQEAHPGMTNKKFRQRDVYHFHARAVYQRFRMTARIPVSPCVWRAGIAD